MSSSKIDKVIARQREKIAEGQFYEAHQQLLVLTSRYLKSTPPAYPTAISLLHSGAALLLESNQGASGGDLALLLLDTYRKSSTAPSPESKGRILSLLRAFPAGEPTRRRFVDQAVDWLRKTNGGDVEGEREVHTIYARILISELQDESSVEKLKSGQTVGVAEGLLGDVAPSNAPPPTTVAALEAEKHLIQGNRDAPAVLSELHAAWFKASQDPSSASSFAARGVFGYLIAGNQRSANQYFSSFTASLKDMPGLNAQNVAGGGKELAIYPSLPGLNFLGLLIASCEKGTPDVFRLLKGHYHDTIDDEPGWEEGVEAVGGIWFGIQKPRQGNPLMDMMAGMFGGGGGGGGGRGGPPALDMD